MKTRTVCETFYVKLELSDPGMTRGSETAVNSWELPFFFSSAHSYHCFWPNFLQSLVHNSTRLCLLLFANSLPGSVILVFSIPIIPSLAEPMDSSPLAPVTSSFLIRFVDMFCWMGIFIQECPRHHLTNWISSIVSLTVFPSLPWVRGWDRCGALYFCLSLVLLSYPCVCSHPSGSFRSLRQLIQQLLCHCSHPHETESTIQVRATESLVVPWRRKGIAMEIETTTRDIQYLAKARTQLWTLTASVGNSLQGETVWLL